MNVHKVSTMIGDRELSIEIGKLAKQAHGSALVRYGDTVVLVTACAAQPREGLDFFPLTVDYRENFYAAGKIPGGFFKREGKPSEREVLNSRMIDSVTAVVTWPVEVWFGGSRSFTGTLDFGGRAITQITLDPYRRFPDRDPSDNVWPRAR